MLGKRNPSDRSISWVTMAAELKRLWMQGASIVGGPDIMILSAIFFQKCQLHIMPLETTGRLMLRHLILDDIDDVISFSQFHEKLNIHTELFLCF